MTAEIGTPNLNDYGDFGGDEAEDALGELKRLTGGNFADLVEGENWFRIVPRKKPLKAFVLVSMHFVDLPGEEHTIAFVCPRKHANRAPCPMCAQADEAYKDASSRNDEKAIKRAKRLYPRTRAYYNVIDRDDEEAGPKVLRMPWGVHKDLMTLVRRKKVSLTNPQEAYDVLIEREGTGKTSTKYTVDIDDGPTELGDLTWLERADHDLERYTAVDPLESIVARLKGETIEASDGSRSLPASATAGAVEAEVVHPRAPHGDRSEDDEEDLPPTRQRKKRSRAAKPAGPEVDTDDEIPF